MFTVFVWEYASAVAAVELPPSIRTEGWAMLSAVLEDFARVGELRVCTLLHAEAADHCRHSGIPVEVDLAGSTEEESFCRLASTADVTLVIAPESGGLLAERCRSVLRVGGRLLGPAPEAVELTSDKLQLAHHLASHGVPTPPCYLLNRSAECPFPAVLKPRDGAGSQATFLVPSRESLADCVVQGRAEGFDGEFIVQPLVHGRAASIAFLLGGPAPVPLLPATQELSDDGRFQYRGGRMPLAGDEGERVVDLGWRAIGTMPGLAGYVGVDIVVGDARAADAVIEINPRLTTSYVGLRVLAESNLAECLLAAVLGRAGPPVRWRPGEVRFDPVAERRPSSEQGIVSGLS